MLVLARLCIEEGFDGVHIGAKMKEDNWLTKFTNMNVGEEQVVDPNRQGGKVLQNDQDKQLLLRPLHNGQHVDTDNSHKRSQVHIVDD